MALRTVGVKLSVSGEKEWAKQMSSVNSSLKTLKSELSLSASEFRGQANSMEALKAKQEILNKQYEQQKEKVRACAEAYESMKAQYGENSEQADKYERQLNSARVALNNMDDELRQNARHLQEAAESSDGCAKSIDEFGREVKDAEKKTSAFGDVLKANLTSEAIIGGVKALVGAFAKVGKEAAATIAATAQYGDSIDKQSQKLRVTAEEYQKLSFAAERCGTSIETLGTAQKTLAGKDFDGNLVDAIDYVASFSDEADRAAAATELFGKKAGQEMLPLLNSGADGIKALYAECETLGGVMSNDAVAAAAKYQDSLTNLKLAFGGLKNNLGSDFLPAVTEIMDGMTLVMSGNVDEGLAAIELGIEHFGEKIDELGPVAEKALELIGRVIADNLDVILGAAADVIEALVSGLLKNLPELIPVAIDLILSLVTTLLDNVDLLIDCAIQLVVGLSVGLLKAIPQLASKIPQIISAIVNGLVSGIGQIASVGADLIRGLWNGISNMGKWIGDKIRGFGQNIVDSLKDFFGIHSPATKHFPFIGEMSAQGIGKGFEHAIDGVADDMADAMTSDITSAMSRVPTSFELATSVSASGSRPFGVSAVDTFSPEGLDAKLAGILVTLRQLAASDRAVVLSDGTIVGRWAPLIDRELARLTAREGRGA